MHERTEQIKKKSDDDERVYFLLTPVDLQQTATSSQQER